MTSSKKALTVNEWRASVNYLVETQGLLVVRACAALSISRTSWYQSPNGDDQGDQDVIEALSRAVEKHPKWGFWKCYDYL